MPSAPPPLVGFNNNVRYRGMRFHIQTEDSGVLRPHILTHLFADGGRVIKSLRTDYTEFVDHPERQTMIQRMMRDQHRAMAIDLRDGRLDATIDGLRSQSQVPGPVAELEEAPTETLKFPAPGTAQAPDARGAPIVVQARRDSSAPPSSDARQERRSRSPGRNRLPSRVPEAGKKRRSGAPKKIGRRSLGRPSAILEATKPSAESIFGAAPQESLDDVILSYVTHSKGTPDSRGRK